MNIDDLTIGKVKEIAAMFAAGAETHQAAYSHLVGRNVVIRTVTMYHVGRLIAVCPQELVLEDAAWVPDSGRWANFLESGELAECEPFPDGKVVIGRGAIVDVCEWRHTLPRDVA